MCVRPVGTPAIVSMDIEDESGAAVAVAYSDATICLFDAQFTGKRLRKLGVVAHDGEQDASVPSAVRIVKPLRPSSGSGGVADTAALIKEAMTWHIMVATVGGSVLVFSVASTQCIARWRAHDHSPLRSLALIDSGEALTVNDRLFLSGGGDGVCRLFLLFAESGGSKVSLTHASECRLGGVGASITCLSPRPPSWRSADESGRGGLFLALCDDGSWFVASWHPVLVPTDKESTKGSRLTFDITPLFRGGGATSRPAPRGRGPTAQPNVAAADVVDGLAVLRVAWSAPCSIVAITGLSVATPPSPPMLLQYEVLLLSREPEEADRPLLDGPRRQGGAAALNDDDDDEYCRPSIQEGRKRTRGDGGSACCRVARVSQVHIADLGGLEAGAPYALLTRGHATNPALQLVTVARRPLVDSASAASSTVALLEPTHGLIYRLR